MNIEKGFYHPQRGYWQTTGEVPKRILDGYPEGTIEVPVKPSADHLWQNGAWVYLAPDPAEVLAAERATMKCSRLQGRLVLGEDTCNALDAMAADPETPWAMRQTIQNATEWNRTSQAMTELGYLLGYTDTQMDDLFRQAMTVDV
jgi:hypothetical protein